VVCGAHSFPAHAVVLAAASPHLAASLSTGWSESQPGATGRRRITLPEGLATPHALGAVLDFCYTGELLVDAHDAYDIVACSELLEMPRLTAAAVAFLVSALSPASALPALLLAERYRLPVLASAAKRYLRLRFSALVADAAGLAALAPLPAKVLVDVLSADELAGASERDVLRAALAWAAAQPPEVGVRALRRRFLPLVRLPWARPGELGDEAWLADAAADAGLQPLPPRVAALWRRLRATRE
jgi:hypothetical protein